MAIKQILTTLFNSELLSDKDNARVDELVPSKGSVSNNKKSKKLLNGIVLSEGQSFLVTTAELGVKKSDKVSTYTSQIMTGALIPMERIENLYKTLD